MSDIRKRTGKKGDTYQVRYADRSSKSGYSFRTFATKKEARAFLEGPKPTTQTAASASSSVSDAVDEWLDICEKEGLNGREPVTAYTLENYTYRATFIKSHAWGK